MSRCQLRVPHELGDEPGDPRCGPDYRYDIAFAAEFLPLSISDFKTRVFRFWFPGLVVYIYPAEGLRMLKTERAVRFGGKIN
jgi:hypothetical protein